MPAIVRSRRPHGATGPRSAALPTRGRTAGGVRATRRRHLPRASTRVPARFPSPAGRFPGSAVNPPPALSVFGGIQSVATLPGTPALGRRRLRTTKHRPAPGAERGHARREFAQNGRTSRTRPPHWSWGTPSGAKLATAAASVKQGAQRGGLRDCLKRGVELKSAPDILSRSHPSGIGSCRCVVCRFTCSNPKSIGLASPLAT